MHNDTLLKFAGVMKILIISLVCLTSCDYEFIEIEDQDPTVPVSFSNDIVSIFTTNSNCTACHRTGATSPDLSAANAYNSIVPALVNLNEPEASKIYTTPAPSSSHASRYTPVQAVRVLNWIKQGAKNN